ncbi:MAG: GNAT family N-acetyltransferase [Salinarimonadaceae bacterium]|nr:MAG: GNAT family N-acetyltransferase [Salinarimonadaceae bacterium]
MASWFSAPAAPSVAPLETAHSRRLAEIHAEAFARPWRAHDFERLLVERTVIGDGLFFGGREAQGFSLSRVVADEAEILTIAIAPAARGKGHSRILLERHLDALARRGVARVHLEVDEGNAPALALYRRFGFAEVGRREGYFLKADGSRATALTMSAEL